MAALALETFPAVTSEGSPWDLSALALCGEWLEGGAASLPFCFSLLKGPQVVLCPGPLACAASPLLSRLSEATAVRHSGP